MAATYRDILNDMQETADRYAERTGQPRWMAVMLEPGWQALAWYRLAHWFNDGGIKVLAMLIMRQVRRATGIDLHPGCKIGRRLVIDAGAPVVVGETAVIGDDCVLEAGAMLMGLPGEGERRHPTLGNGVVVEAGAIVTGDVFLGHDVRVAAGTVLTRDVPDGGMALGVPGRVLPRIQARPDPDAKAVQALAERLYHLEEQLHVLAFQVHRSQGPGAERWRTRQPEQYGPIPAVEELIDGAGI